MSVTIHSVNAMIVKTCTSLDFLIDHAGGIMKSISEKSEKMFNEYEKMLPVLSYIMEHAEEKITQEDLCSMLKCSENTLLRKFRKYFGVSCERFIMMIKMRMAARDLLSGESVSPKILSEKYEFSNLSSFSKAFKREIGTAPRNFLKGQKRIPDMPMPKTFHGHKAYFKYMKVEEFNVYGYKIPLINGIRTDLLRECAYPLEHGSEHLNLYGNKDQIGFWWSDVADEMYYILGYKTYSQYDIPDDALQFHFGGSGYAVFSIERSDNEEETLLAHRMMAYYAMMLWRWINNKTGNTMLYTFEVFGKNYTYIYLPLSQGLPEDTENVMISTGLDEWITFIDRSIMDGMAIEEIAAHFNYSERHFCRIFKNYFAYSASEYIRKKRLHLAARDLKNAKTNKDKNEIMLRYQFEDCQAFRKEFWDEFQMEPENYLEVSFHVPNLSRYFSDHKDQIRLRTLDIEEMKMIGKTLQARDPFENEAENLDIPDLTAYWMRHDPDELIGTRYACTHKGRENKLALWNSEAKTGTNEYILGPVVETLEDIPAGYKTVTIPAGKYVVIESLSESDEGKLTDVHRLLSRCSYGWIKEYQFRVNLERLTFVQYNKKKLYFYIPVYE